jgi:hypothetical protein
MHTCKQYKGEVFPADTMKAYRRYKGTTALILNLILNGDEWSTSCLGHFSSKDRMPATHPLNKRVGHPQSQAGHFREQKNLLCLTKYESWVAQPTA